jgi:hypothetical protein
MLQAKEEGRTSPFQQVASDDLGNDRATETESSTEEQKTILDTTDLQSRFYGSAYAFLSSTEASLTDLIKRSAS